MKKKMVVYWNCPWCGWPKISRMSCRVRCSHVVKAQTYKQARSIGDTLHAASNCPSSVFDQIFTSLYS